MEKKKSLFEINLTFGGTSMTQIALLAKNLAVMLRSGMPISEALRVSEETALGRLKKILGKVIVAVDSGSTLADALGRHPKVFSNLFISATYAGERSGRLEQNLDNVAEHLEKQRALVMKVKGAMMYPIVVLVAAFALSLLLAFFVLPRITPLFEGLHVDLPVTTRALIAFSNFIQNNGVVFMVAVVAVVVAVVWLIRQKFMRPLTHWLLLHIPAVSKITKGTNTARFCRSLSSLLESGLNIDEALQVAERMMNNYYYQKAAQAISHSVGTGSKLSDNLEEQQEMFPLMVSRMVKVGEQSGGLEQTLKYLAHYYEEEVENSLKNFSATIEPLLLIIIGVVVAFLGLSIITPMYEISGGIKR